MDGYLKFYPKNTQFILVTGLQDQGTTPATYIGTGTFTATLNDSSGNAVTGATNMSGTCTNAGAGDWEFQLDAANFNPPTGYDYTLVIDGTAGTGAVYHAELPAWVVPRQTGTET